MLPAYAGMIPVWETSFLKRFRAPRIRGDDPYYDMHHHAMEGCSPHTRG